MVETERYASMFLTMECEESMLTRTCIQCNKEFTMTESEIRFYKSKRLSLPKRCKECRDANKKLKAENGGQMPEKNSTVETIAVKKGRMGILPVAIGAVAVIVILILVLSLLP